MTIGPAWPLSFSGILLSFLAMQYPDEFIKENLQFFNPKTSRQSKSYLLLLLQTPIADYRKNAVALVLAPYLIGIRGMPSDEATKVILGWLERCNAVRRLDFRPRKAARQRSNRRRRRRIEGIESYPSGCRSQSTHATYKWRNCAMKMVLQKSLILFRTFA
jgi:hypothetical protein